MTMSDTGSNTELEFADNHFVQEWLFFFCPLKSLFIELFDVIFYFLINNLFWFI